MNTPISLISFLLLVITVILVFALILDLIAFFLKSKQFPKSLMLSTIVSIILFSAVLLYYLNSSSG
ncbi:hypothetical protein J4760_02635 [Salinicoccus sp. ID82-1]|uniref:hypothetical protein n=1 Tax=Salinicoccus sp. ID82-1 TaxID=2820269 RepID=UPI001F2AF847|nr:hypothetical protein [Salinicoccus sp. ID82-1]MCG1008945.1 hypothetical protein [Salinicoccus sp. ID82-1]